MRHQGKIAGSSAWWQVEYKSTVALAAKKTNHILGCITLSTTSWLREVIVEVYTGLVCPHIEYYVQFWDPQYKKDIKLSENVQRRVTKMVKGLQGKT